LRPDIGKVSGIRIAPMGRWLDETQASALISVTLRTSREQLGF
jgi:hypothetical protein